MSRSGWWPRRQLLGRAAAPHKSPSSKLPALGEAGEEVVVKLVVEAEEDPLAPFFSGAALLAATALGTARALEEEGAWVGKFAIVLFKVLVKGLLSQTIEFDTQHNFVGSAGFFALMSPFMCCICYKNWRARTYTHCRFAYYPK